METFANLIETVEECIIAFVLDSLTTLLAENVYIAQCISLV